jgi:hypothetical protein
VGVEETEGEGYVLGSSEPESDPFGVLLYITAMNPRVPQNAIHFLTSSETTSFSSGTPLHRVSGTLFTQVRYSDLKNVPDLRGFRIS